MVEVLETTEALDMVEIVEERMGVEEWSGMVGLEETEDMVEVVTNWKVMMKNTIVKKKLFVNCSFFTKD